MQRKTLLTTPRFTVEKRRYEDASGHTCEKDVIIHPGAVVIVPVLADRRIVMIENRRIAVEETLLELPAGTRSPGETSLETAHRELVEETGYRAASMEPLTEFFASPGICNELMSCFVARDLNQVGQQLEPGEEIKVVTMSRAALRVMIGDGTLRDGKTIAALGTFFGRESSE